MNIFCQDYFCLARIIKKKHYKVSTRNEERAPVNSELGKPIVRPRPVGLAEFIMLLIGNVSALIFQSVSPLTTSPFFHHYEFNQQPRHLYHCTPPLMITIKSAWRNGLDILIVSCQFLITIWIVNFQFFFIIYFVGSVNQYAVYKNSVWKNSIF